jgi:hypothetical protein
MGSPISDPDIAGIRTRRLEFAAFSVKSRNHDTQA